MCEPFQRNTSSWTRNCHTFWTFSDRHDNLEEQDRQVWVPFPCRPGMIHSCSPSTVLGFIISRLSDSLYSSGVQGFFQITLHRKVIWNSSMDTFNLSIIHDTINMINNCFKTIWFYTDTYNSLRDFYLISPVHQQHFHIF